jgi:acyl carrier protein
MKEEKLEELRRLVSDALDLDEAKVLPDALFIDDLGVDSLMALEVLVRMEKKYSIKIPESELKKMVSLRGVYSLLESKGVF